jgi:Zn ribbon nucleic-acid-binding protein
MSMVHYYRTETACINGLIKIIYQNKNNSVPLCYTQDTMFLWLQNRIHIWVFVKLRIENFLNLYIEEEQTTQWPKEKVQKDKQQSTKHTHKTKDRVTRTPLKTGGELRCSGRVSSSLSIWNLPPFREEREYLEISFALFKNTNMLIKLS